MSIPPGATQTEREPPFANSAMILGALPGGALIVDRSGVVRQANLAATHLLGCSVADLVGAELASLPGGADILAVEDLAAGAIEVGGRTLHIHKRPLRADDRQAQQVGSLVLLDDRTDELAARHDRYEHVSRALHDVRVPLQAIGGAAEGLLRGWFGPLADEQREFVEMIKENAGRQGDLFSNLFDVYTLAEGMVPLHAERMHAEGLVQEVVFEFAPRFEARGVALALEIQADLLAVLADRRHLRQVLVALLENALKYTYPDGSVAVHAFEHGGELRVDVRDTGVGIKAADQPQIFRPFFRGESPLREGRYGGLNLAIARKLVELHGGRMWFESVEGQGSTFSFTLPICPPSEAVESAG
jgi:signal transduction histidine kinase